MKFFRLFFFLLSLAAALGARAAAIAGSLDELNQVLAQKAVYFKQRTDRITLLTNQFYQHQNDDAAKFDIGLQIYQEYSSFKYDSSFAYALRIKDIATKMHSPQKVELAKLNLAFIHVSSGMFKETFETLNDIHPALLDTTSRIEFYFLEARSYSDLADFNPGGYYRSGYTAKAIACIDTALQYTQPDTYDYYMLQGFKALKSNKIADARSIYSRILQLPGLTLHQVAINASTLAWVYELDGNLDKAFDLLTQAAIADGKTATTEAVALLKLSDMCYRRGDLKNAYTFINHARDDAAFYNARLRQIQIGSIFSVIEGQKISIIEKQRQTLTIYVVAITALALFIIAFLIIIFRQLRKLQSAEAAISAINQELQANNHYLSELNHQLDDANHKLNDVNRIKDEYIGYYFNISSEYIDKIENIKSSMDKSLSGKQYVSIQKTVDSINIKKERNELFKGFDTVFLKLFPNFVAAFNALLRADERIALIEDQLLNTELRIFALIRLGIDDSERISKILGYTISTIYTYKTRVKKKSIYPSEEFEGRVRAIQAS